MQKGTFALKLKGTFALSLAASPIALLINHLSEWYSDNYIYVAFILIAIFLDHFFGSWVHLIIRRDFTIKKNVQGFVIKALLVLAVAVLLEGISHILGKNNFITQYFKIISQLMVFIYPAGSALVNCSIITNGAFPPIGFLKKIKRFNEEMDIEQFKKKNSTNA